MANTFILGGSPLGLIGVQSRPTRDGMSTFNGGKDRNVNVLAYNLGRKQNTNVKDEKRGILQAGVSLFTGGLLPQFWGNIGKVGTEMSDADAYKGINRDTLHNNDVYDTSILNIIEKLSACPKASLRPQDFAYLKDLGVYPNNRLMIARKFAMPQKDNILDKNGQAPLSTIISWKKPADDFLKITYGEEWGDAEADFTSVLNSLGDEFGLGGGGSGLGKALNVLPLPGFTESLQRDLLVKLGILDKNGALPAGDPNLIKQAKQRKLVGYGSPGSGLVCIVSIAMESVYEQKFISGIDPTIAYMDILSNLVHFGTQNSRNFGVSKAFVKKLDSWTTKPMLLVTEMITILKTIFTGLQAQVKAFLDKKETDDAAKPPAKEEEADKKKRLEKIKDEVIKQASAFGASIINTLDKTVRKYKIQIMGIANSLSGSPSTPWHITIGNPLRPIFCSGDMFTMRVSLDLGKDLAFNDLPSTIKVSFTLENARPWGLQEIMSKFNTGYVRTVNVRQDFSVSDVAGKNYSLGFQDSDFIENTPPSGGTPSTPGGTPPTTGGTPPVPAVTGGTASATKVGEDAGAKQNE